MKTNARESEETFRPFSLEERATDATKSVEKLQALEQIDVEMDYTLIYLKDDGVDLVDYMSMCKLYYKRSRMKRNEKISTAFRNKVVKVQVLRVDGSLSEVSIPHYFLCPLCLEPFYRPATLSCGHTFCSFCLLQSNLRWAFRKCPFCFKEYESYVINVILEADVDKALKRSVYAGVCDQVMTLVKYNNINAFATGSVVDVRPGYLTKQMNEWALSRDIQLASKNIVKECRPSVEQCQDESFVSNANDPQFIPARICLVQINNAHFKGTLSQTFPLNFLDFVLATRPHRGAYVISRDNVRVLYEKTQNGSNNVLVYNPSMPKFTYFYDKFLDFDESHSIYKLIADEPILNKITLYRNQSKFDTDDTENFLRVAITFTYKYQNSPFICSACKQLYRLPVQLICGCSCCFSCARDLYNLKLPCLKCGQPIAKRYGLNSIDKKLILQMYSKLPEHAPMLDKNLPVYVGERVGILIDEPNRINCWVLFGPGDIKYVHSIHLRPVQIVKMYTALLFEGDGILYINKYFGIVQKVKDAYIYADRYCLNGKEISRTELLLNAYRLVDDLRADIVYAKIDGAAQKQKKSQSEVAQIRQRIIDRLKEREKEQKTKYQSCQFDTAYQYYIIERRKRLHMVDFNNPEAKFHPGNQILPQYESYESAKLRQSITNARNVSAIRKNRNWVIDAAFRNPDLTFLCSACWYALKIPVVLACGHVCCRRCATIYFYSERDCLVCGMAVYDLSEVYEDQALREELIYSLDTKIYCHGVNVGMFASVGGAHGMITDVNAQSGEICVCTGIGSVVTYFKDMELLDVVGKADPGVSEGTLVRIVGHRLAGMLGIVIGTDGELMRVLLESGIEKQLQEAELEAMRMAPYINTEKAILERRKEEERLRRNQIAEEIKREMGIAVGAPTAKARIVKSTQVKQQLVRRGGSVSGMQALKSIKY